MTASGEALLPHDLDAVVAYLKTVKPLRSEIPLPVYKMPYTKNAANSHYRPTPDGESCSGDGRSSACAAVVLAALTSGIDSEPDAGVKDLPNGGFDVAATAEADPKRSFAHLSMGSVRAPALGAATSGWVRRALHLALFLRGPAG